MTQITAAFFVVKKGRKKGGGYDVTFDSPVRSEKKRVGKGVGTPGA